jgi:hypothetical protein
MRARSVWLAGITAVGVLLGGCANEDAPGTLPVVTTTPRVVSPTATEAEEKPAHVDSHEAELEKHLTDYIDASNRSWNSSSALDERRSYFADSCEGCLRGWTMAREAFEAGHEYDGRPIELRSLTVDSIAGDRAVVRAHVLTPAAVLRDPQGIVLQEFRGSDYTLIYQFQRQPSGKWLIIDDEVLPG